MQTESYNSMVSYASSFVIAIAFVALLPRTVSGFSFSLKTLLPQIRKRDEKQTSIDNKKIIDRSEQELSSMSVEFLDAPRIDNLKQDQINVLMNDLNLGKQVPIDTITSDTVKKTTDEPNIFQKLTRGVQVYWMFFHIFFDYKMSNRKELKIRKTLGISEEEDYDSYPELVTFWKSVHDRNSKRLLKGIRSLTGFWVKVGQFLSSRTDIVPPEYLTTLSTLQDSMPSKCFSEIEQTLSEQLSKEEKSLIQHIDPTPLATASIAQVHRATLTDGRKVVIKVQHRGVSSIMLQDMENLRILLALLNKLEPDSDYSPIAREYTAEVKKELDFRIESKNMEDVSQVLEENNVRVIIPKTVPGLVKEKVLVMDFCEGFPARETRLYDVHKVDRKLFLDRICAAWAAQMHISGVFNADPHMGNILVSTITQDDGDTSIPILLDFGLTKRFQPRMKIAFARLMHALDETDIDSLMLSFEEMGMQLNRYDPFGDMAAMQRSFRDPPTQSEAKQVSKEKKVEYKRKMDAMREDEGLEKGQKLRNPVDAWPQELILYGRVTNMLRGLCTALEIQYPYLKTMANAARKTLNDEVLNSQKICTGVNKGISVSTNGVLEQRLLKSIEKYKKTSGDMLGLQLSVFKEGGEVVNISTGVLGKINPRPVTASTLFCIFSVSKSVLSMGLLRLLQDENIGLDDPISKYWPAFGANGKENITIRHALSHQSGLANALPKKVSLETLLDWSSMKKVIEEAIPSHLPGADTKYHSLSFAWISGGIIESVTGLPYEKYLEDTIITPLNMQNILYMAGLPAELNADENVATLSFQNEMKDSPQSTSRKMKTHENADKRKNEQLQGSSENGKTGETLEKYRGTEQLMNPLIFNMKSVRESKLPSANGYCSASGLASLYARFIDTKNVEPLISNVMFAEARKRQLPHSNVSDLADSELLSDSSAHFGLGFQLHEFLLPDGKIVTSIGHAGIGGTIVLAIPELMLSIAFTTNMLTTTEIVKKELLQIIMEEYGVRPCAGNKLYI